MTPALFDIYIKLLEVIAVLVVPASLYCTIRAWEFVRRYRNYRLPWVFALVNTIAFPIATFIGFLAYSRLVGNEIPPWVPLVTAPAFLILDIIPLLTTGYLVWLDRKVGDGRSHPSE